MKLSSSLPDCPTLFGTSSNLSGGPVSLEFNHDEVADCVDAEQVDIAAEIRLDLAVDDEKTRIQNGDVAGEPFLKAGFQVKRRTLDLTQVVIRPDPP